MVTLEKAKELKKKIDALSENVPFDDATKDQFRTLLQEFLDNIYELHQSKVSAVDIQLLIEEMRHGFELMEKRFEAIDKRFEEQIEYTDKRFEEQREYTDKRFDAIDKRFNFMQWLIMLGTGILAFLISYFSSIYRPDYSSNIEKKLDKLIELQKNNQNLLLQKIRKSK